MNLRELILENNPGKQIIGNPSMVKMLMIAMDHDKTLPKTKLARLGHKPSAEELVNFWSDLIDNSLRSTNYGDLSRDSKLDSWIIDRYINFDINYEGLNGEGGDALGAWKALSRAGVLLAQHSDLNKFKKLSQIQQVVRSQRAYSDALSLIKDKETIEKHKRTKQEVVLMDTDRFLVLAPMNYGACYTFNRTMGHQSTFCTGSSSGLDWFKRYAPEGMIISVVDKNNMDDKDGKWQMHAPTKQLVNSMQDDRGASILYKNDEKFARLFPGLMKQIVDSIVAHADEIKEVSRQAENAKPGGYDASEEANLIARTFPVSYASTAETDQEEPQADQEPEEREYLVTQLSSGRTARVTGTSSEAVLRQIQARHPNITADDLDIRPATE